MDSWATMVYTPLISIQNRKDYESSLVFQSAKPSNEENSGKFSRSISSCSSHLSSDDSRLENSVTSISNARKKDKPLIREVKLQDDTTSCDELAIQKKPSQDSEHLTVKRRVEDFRKQRGNDWLVASRRSEEDFPLPRVVNNLSNIISSSNSSSDNLSIASEVSESVEETIARVEENGNETGQQRMSSDNNLEPEIDEAILAQVDYISETISDKYDYVDDDNDDYTGELFIVNRHHNSKVDNLFVWIGVDKIREKDTLTGHTIECFDIESLLRIEKLPNLRHGMRLLFDSVYRNRKERIYTLEDEKHTELLLSLLQPYVDARVLKDACRGYECLVCNAQFSKNVAKLKLQVTKDAVKCANGKTKDLLVEVDACPNCDSIMIIELEDELYATVNKTENEIKEPLNTNLTHKSLSKIKSPSHSYPSSPQFGRKYSQTEEINQNQIPNSKQRCCHSLEVSPLSQSPDDTRNAREESVARISEENSNNAIIQSWDFPALPFSQQKLNFSTVNEPESSAIHRSESDVSILSNPSQSSISVLSTPSGDQNMIDDQQRFDSVFPYETRVDSRQSNSSVTGSYSSSTTVERSVVDGMSSTPSNDENCDFDRQNIISKNIDVVQSDSIVYDFDDFAQIDHKIQLYLDLNLFESGEEFKLILKANVVSPKLNDVPALFIISSKHLYIMKITGEESVEPLKWLQKVDVKNISQLKVIRQHLSHQAFFLEFHKQNKPTYMFLLRDSERCKRFVKQLTCFYESVNSSVQTIEPQDNLMNNLTLILNDECRKLNCDDFCIFLYILGFYTHSVKGNASFEPVSFVVTRNCVFVLSENHQSYVNGKSEKTFQVLHHENVFTLTGMTLYRHNQCEATMMFHNEDTNEKFDWTVLMESEHSLHVFIDAIQKPWQKLFDIDLPTEVC